MRQRACSERRSPASANSTKPNRSSSRCPTRWGASPPPPGARAPADHLAAARFDGQAWSDVTPPEFPYSSTLLKPGAGAPLLLSPHRSARLTAAGWQPIAMPDCMLALDPDTSIHPVRVGPDGAVVLAASGCLGRLGAGDTQVQAVGLPGGVSIHDVAMREGDTYVIVERDSSNQLLRLVR